jgi:hypothetical protein
MTLAPPPKEPTVPVAAPTPSQRSGPFSSLADRRHSATYQNMSCCVAAKRYMTRCWRPVETMMQLDEYCRLYAACLVSARQPDLPGVQARWLVMAQASLDLASIVDDKKRRHSPYEIPLRLRRN